MKRITSLILSLAAAALLVATLPRLAPIEPTERIATNTPSEPAVSAPVPGEASLRATINPETGKVDVSTIPSGVQSTQTLDPETAEALRRDTDGLKQVHHPNGAVSVDLQGRFQNATVARIDKNGKVLICTENGEDIDAVLEGHPVAAPTTPEVQ